MVYDGACWDEDEATCAAASTSEADCAATEGCEFEDGACVVAPPSSYFATIAWEYTPAEDEAVAVLDGDKSSLSCPNFDTVTDGAIYRVDGEPVLAALTTLGWQQSTCWASPYADNEWRVSRVVLQSSVKDGAARRSLSEGDSADVDAFKVEPPAYNADDTEGKFRASDTNLGFYVPAGAEETWEVLALRPDPYGELVVTSSFEVEGEASGRWVDTALSLNVHGSDQIFAFVPSSAGVEITTVQRYNDDPLHGQVYLQAGGFEIFGDVHKVGAYGAPYDASDRSDWGYGPGEHYHTYSTRRRFFQVQDAAGNNGAVWQDSATKRIFASYLNGADNTMLRTTELSNERRCVRARSLVRTAASGCARDGR